MKKKSILIVGLGVPTELTDVLLREGCDICALKHHCKQLWCCFVVTPRQF